MLVDAVRWGKLTYVDPALLDRCIDSVLSILMGVVITPGILSEIAWRTAHSTETTYPKWELLAAVAADIAYPGSTAYDQALRNLELAICAGDCEAVRRALVSVLKSTRLSARFLADLYDICVVADDIGSAELLTTDLTTDFYLAVLPHLDSQNPDLADMAARISDNLAKDHDTVVVG
ncbi:hypothetical protein EV175_005134 [Coemansia sp. RSA 1933]|nr:hypothetical protein EV175_005134 [Coemansia sp. RSA 1933]